jgi:hypothetical protein
MQNSLLYQYIFVLSTQLECCLDTTHFSRVSFDPEIVAACEIRQR